MCLSKSWKNHGFYESKSELFSIIVILLGLKYHSILIELCNKEIEFEIIRYRTEWKQRG